MASTEYAPGTVAVATVRGVKDVRVFRRDAVTWVHAEVIDGCIGSGSRDVTNIRPLVVLDLDTNDLGVMSDAWANVERAMKDGHSLPFVIENLRDQIEAQTKPSRIPEPGLWGVVEAREENAVTTCDWVHLPTGAWASLGGSRLSTWSNLVDPTLIREGVES